MVPEQRTKKRSLGHFEKKHGFEHYYYYYDLFAFYGYRMAFACRTGLQK
jgi:hypothetical protein